MLEANTGVTDTSVSAASPSAPQESVTTPEQTVQPATQSAAPEIDPATGQPLAPAFQPDWKFKVKDKEFEIDEFARSGIKDEETYKKMKRLYERSHGLDEVVQSRDQLKAQYEAAQPTLKEYGQVTKSLNEISHFYNTKDYDSFFERLNIPFDVIFNYVKSKHQQSTLPAEVQQQLESARQANIKAYNYEQELLGYKQDSAQTEAQQKIQYLDSVISAKAGDVAQKFNEVNGGNPAAFRQFVIFKGQQLSQELGRIATPEEVVDRCRDEMVRFSGNPQAQAAAPTQPGSQAPAKPPVIPNVRAGAQSPVRQPVKSIDDLKKIHQSM